MGEKFSIQEDAAAFSLNLHLDSHTQWMHAFNWWYHSGKRNWIIDNLRNAVELSNRDSIFLAAILDGKVKPLSGKQSGLALFTSNIIDNKIQDLRTQGKSREEINEVIQRSELAVMGMDGLDKRIYRKKIDPVKKRAELDKKFCDMYEKNTQVGLMDASH